jgi:hypothetical protein
MILIKCIVITIVAMILLLEFANLMTYGGFINKRLSISLMNLKEDNLRLNPFNPSILGGTPYISTHKSLLCKYHVQGIGQVPRWSKLHNRIEEYYVIALRNTQK